MTIQSYAETLQGNKLISLYPSCILVRGAMRSTICDLDRHKYFLIPNSLYDLLQEFNRKPLIEIFAAYPDDIDALEEYFEFLFSNDFIVLIDATELSLFPELNKQFLNRTQVNNAILDINPLNPYPLQNIAPQLKELGCEHLQIRLYKPASISFLTSVLELFQDKNLSSIQLVAAYNPLWTFSDLKVLLEQFHLHSIDIHSTPANICEEEMNFDNQRWNVKFYQKAIEDHTYCGVVNAMYFRVNTPLYLESLQFNTCLNRKISVDENGEIKNCPSMTRSFGNIQSTSLQEVIAMSDFTNIWNISKDQIRICQDCEFRYICTDCRAFTQNNDPFGKPAKCGYDPYTATWLFSTNDSD